MYFQIGSYYDHPCGLRMKVLGELTTVLWGCCLIGETSDGKLIPVTRDSAGTINWKEIDACDLYQPNSPTSEIVSVKVDQYGVPAGEPNG